MGEVTGHKVSGKFPKTLESMLDILLVENGLRSWSIYDDKFGVSVRLRFDSGMHTDGAGIVDMQGTQANTQANIHSYSRKTPSQIRRDTQRRTLRAKRQRTHSDNEIENERTNDVEENVSELFNTPIDVACEPPKEDTLQLTPLTPIKIEFGDTERLCVIENGSELNQNEHQEMKESEHVVNCPNCDEPIEKWNHVCGEKTTVTSDDYEIVSCKFESSQLVSKRCKLGELVCCIDEENGWHAKQKLHRCHSCMFYVCNTCRPKIRKGHIPGCCENMKLSEFETRVPYDIAYPP